MADSASQCVFTFDPAAWEDETGMSSPLSDELLDDGVWQCSRDAASGEDRCLFHLPPERTDDRAVRDAFLASIDESGDEPKRFIGARFGRLDLDYQIVACADNHEIDLRHARFEAPVTFRYAIVRQPIVFDGALFEQRPDFTEARFEGPVTLDKARFETPARFLETEFADSFVAYRTRFREGNFHNARFGELAEFTDARFERAQFRETDFEAIVRFNQTVFEEPSFSGSRFAGAVYFDEATVPESVGLRKARFDELVSFESLDLAAGTCYLDCKGARFAAGRLYLPEDGTAVYDLTDATIGEVELADGQPRADLFDHYRFLNTTFERFDFGSYRSVFHECDWRIHDVVDVPHLETEESPSAGERETTYLKAKNGANEVGETKAAAEFFRREMLARRAQYLPGDPWRWTANLLLDLTAGYGERPSRVVGVSIGTILGFAGAFAVLRSTPPYGNPVGYFVLSLQSFVTLVLGGAEDAGGPWIRLLAQIEGFVGAFLIALFVFTLTRSIHR